MNRIYQLLVSSFKTQSVIHILSLVLFLGFSSSMFADCTCGSTDTANPCTSNNITVSVTGDNRTIAIDWLFNSAGEPAICGQFANGDFWVAPASGMSEVTFTEIKSTGSAGVTVDANPQQESHGILSKDYGRLDPAENIISQLPMSFTKATSLLAAVERDEIAHGDCGTKSILGSCVDVYNVVTVLDAIPQENGARTLRPSLDEEEKELLTLDDFDLSRLPQVDYLTGGDAESLEDIRRTWSHAVEIFSFSSKSGSTDGFGEGGRAFRAHLVNDDYAAGTASRWHSNLATLMSDDNSLAEETKALAAMLTYGKDIYYAVFSAEHKKERFFITGAGQFLGRFPAAVFFASLTKDSSYGDALKQIAITDADKGGIAPNEIGNINLGEYGPVWGEGPEVLDEFAVGRYWGEVLLMQRFDGASGNFPSVNRGRRTSRDPHRQIDGPGVGPGGGYMSITMGSTRSFVAEMLMIPKMCEIVNFPRLTEYVFRFEDFGLQTRSDVCAPPDPRENPENCDTFRRKGCSYYGLSNTGMATWGPKPDDITQCITNNSGDRTGQTGRFPADHGSKPRLAYFARQFEDNFATIRAQNPVCGASDRPNPPTNIQID